MYHTPAAAAGGPGDVVTRASTDVAYVPYTHYKVANGGGAPTPGGPPHLNSPDSGIGDPTVTTSKIRASLKCSPAPIIACVPASCVDPDGVVVAPPPPGPPPAGGPPPSFDHYPHTDLPINICAGGGNGGGGTGSTGQSASKLFFTLAFAAAQPLIEPAGRRRRTRLTCSSLYRFRRQRLLPEDLGLRVAGLRAAERGEGQHTEALQPIRIQVGVDPLAYP